MVPYLRQFSAVVQKIHFWCYLGQVCIGFDINLTPKFLNLVSNTSTKESKKAPYAMSNLHFLVQFDAHIVCEICVRSDIFLPEYLE